MGNIGATGAGVALPRGLPRTPFLGPVAAVVGTLLLVLAGTLPVWGMRLLAPQYPKGLGLWFYGGRTEGPVTEVNNLNHYVGMRPIDLSEVGELALWPLAIVACALLLVAGILLRGWPGRLALVGLLLVPVVILADIQRYLIMYGSQLDRGSALRLDPFVPVVVGPSSVWNFTIWTYPGPALLIIWLVVALALIARRAAPVGRRLAIFTVAAVAVITVVGTLLVVMPSVRTEPVAGAQATHPAGPIDLVAVVDAAPAGSTVVVPAGTYAVHLQLQRPITLVADGEVVLDGSGRGTVVTISADDVTVRGFQIVNTGGQVEDAAAIKTVQASRVRIEANRIAAFFTGIWVNGGESIAIVDNVLTGSGQVTIGGDHSTSGAPVAVVIAGGEPASMDMGMTMDMSSTGSDPHAGHGSGAGPVGQGDAITLWTAHGITVRGNTIRDARDGIFVNYANEVLIDSNVIEHSRYAIHAMFGEDLTVFGNTARVNVTGLVFMYSSRVLAGRNVLTDSQEAGIGVGIVIKDVVGVQLAENRIERNRVGLQVDGTVHHDTAEALVVRNRFAGNGVGVALFASADLAFAANDFDGNLTQVLALEPGVERHNDWTNGGTGNTWSDYAGFDINGDGIGDVPYVASGLGPVLTTSSPALELYRTAPAMAVLGTAQSIWESSRGPVVRDFAPRIAAAVNLSSVAGGPGVAIQSAVAGPAVAAVQPAVAVPADQGHAGHAMAANGAPAAGAAASLDGDFTGSALPWRLAGLALVLAAALVTGAIRRAPARSVRGTRTASR